MRVCRACRVQDELGAYGRQDEQDKQDERGAYGSLFRLSFSGCPFYEHILRKKNAPSRLQERFTPPRATRK